MYCRTMSFTHCFVFGYSILNIKFSFCRFLSTKFIHSLCFIDCRNFFFSHCTRTELYVINYFQNSFVFSSILALLRSNATKNKHILWMSRSVFFCQKTRKIIPKKRYWNFHHWSIKCAVLPCIAKFTK